MPPSKLIDLLAPGHEDFPFANWNEEFGPYSYFKIVGYKELTNILCALLGKSKQKVVQHIKGFIGPANDALPLEWRSAMQSQYWDGIGEKHISGAYGAATRYEKACLAILCLEQALKSAKVNLDIYKFVRLAPAIYVIDGFIPTFLTQLKHHRMPALDDTVYNRLLSHFDPTPDFAHDSDVRRDGLSKKTSDFLDEVSNQYSITRPTASEILSFLKSSSLDHGLQIRRLIARNDGKIGKQKRPCAGEILPFDGRALRAAIPPEIISLLSSCGFRVA